MKKGRRAESQSAGVHKPRVGICRHSCVSDGRGVKVRRKNLSNGDYLDSQGIGKKGGYYLFEELRERVLRPRCPRSSRVNAEKTEKIVES